MHMTINHAMEILLEEHSNIYFLDVSNHLLSCAGPDYDRRGPWTQSVERALPQPKKVM